MSGCVPCPVCGGSQTRAWHRHEWHVDHTTPEHEDWVAREARVTASLARAAERYAHDNPDVRVIDADLLPGGDPIPGDVDGREADRAAAAWENSWMSQLEGGRWAC